MTIEGEKMLKHIYTDINGIVHFDRYFKYLNDVKEQMPPNLFDFANDRTRYELDGEKTLHDTWIQSINIENRYMNDSNTKKNCSIKIELISSSGKTFSLDYQDAIGFECALQPKQWMDKAVDLLVHEVRVEENGFFSHYFEFDRNVWILVLFKQFSVTHKSEI